jgi:YgiT-type zinc finger domain-containing protein
MAALKDVEYGTCPCGGHYESREVEVRITTGHGLIVLPGVPQGSCRRCSSRVYKTWVLEIVESVMREGQVGAPRG